MIFSIYLTDICINDEQDFNSSSNFTDHVFYATL